MLIDRALEVAPSDAVLVLTRRGATARGVARWKAPIWVLAAGPDPSVMQGLTFSYGVHPIDLAEEPDHWRGYAERVLSELGLPCKQVLLVAGPSPRNPEANQRLELMVF
jgi:pyruvate kinase